MYREVKYIPIKQSKSPLYVLIHFFLTLIFLVPPETGRRNQRIAHNIAVYILNSHKPLISPGSQQIKRLIIPFSSEAISFEGIFLVITLLSSSYPTCKFLLFLLTCVCLLSAVGLDGKNSCMPIKFKDLVQEGEISFSRKAKLNQWQDNWLYQKKNENKPNPSSQHHQEKVPAAVLTLLRSALAGENFSINGSTQNALSPIQNTSQGSPFHRLEWTRSLVRAETSHNQNCFRDQRKGM